MATDAEMKAGIAAASKNIEGIIRGLNAFEQGPAEKAFTSHPQVVQSLVHDVLTAAEHARSGG